MIPFPFQAGQFGRQIVAPAAQQTVLLFNFTGADGTTTFTDESGQAGGFTAFGDAQINSNALLLDGNGDRIQRTSGAASLFEFGTGDFTIEWFSTKSANGTAGFDVLLDVSGNSSGTSGFFIELSSSRGFGFARNGTFTTFSASSPNDSTEHWYALSRTSGTLAAHIDSSRVYNATNTNAFGVNAALSIGNLSGLSTYPFNGRINAIRIIKGTGLYPSATTPPSLPLTIY